MNKRTKLILGIVIGAVIILSGTVFGLAKYGVIHIKMLADTGPVNVVLNVTRSDGQSAIGQQIVLHQKTSSSTTLGTQIGVQTVGTNGQVTFSVARNYWYDFDQINPCQGSLMNVHITSTTGSPVTYALTLNCGGTGTCGSQTCSATQHCNASNTCVNNCTATSCPAGQACNAATKECQTGTQTPHELTLYIAVKTDCTDAVCTNRDSYSKVNGIPISFGSFSGTTNNSLSQGYNLQFSNVMTGNYTFKINDSVTAGYNSAYESKTVTQNVYDSTGSTLVLFKLAKKTVTPGGGTYSLVGYVKDSVTGSFLSGVSVGGITTGTDGKYTITDLKVADAGTAKFTFHLEGYNDIPNITLKDLLVGYPPSSSSYYYNNTKLVMMTKKGAVDDGKVKIVGMVERNDSYKPVAGVKIIVKLDDGTSFETISKSDIVTVDYGTGVDTKQYRYNYLLEVPRPKSCTDNFTVHFSISNIPDYFVTDSQYRGHVSCKSVYFDRLVFLQKTITDETFVAYGSVNVPAGISTDSIKVTVSAPQINFSKTVSLLENFRTEYAPLITNNNIKYIIPDISIAKDSNVLYTIEISPVLIGTSPSRAVVKDQSDAFLTASLVPNSQLNKKTIRTDFEYVGAASTGKAISFYDAVTGKEIDLKEEKPITESDGYVFNALRLMYQVGGWTNSQSERLASDNTYIYSFTDQDISKAPRYYILFFESEHYRGGGILSLTEDKIYLAPKNVQGDAFYCKAINGLKFCTPKALKDQIFTQSNIDNMKKYAALITYWRSKTSLFQGDAVYIEYNNPNGEQSIVYFLPPFLLANFTQGIEHFYRVVGREAYDTLSEGERALVHNIVYDLFYLSQYPTAKETDQPISSYNQWFYEFKPLKIEASSPYQSWLATNDDDFNIYFLWWLLRGDSFNQAIERASSLKLTDIEYRMKALDAFFQAKFPGIQRFGTSGSPTPTNDEFLKIMHDAGYFEIKTTPYKTITSGNTMQALSADQIASGVWLKENYDKLPATQKLDIQLSIQTQKVVNVATTISNATVNAVRTAIAAINNEVEKILQGLGFKFSATSISGKVRDSDGKALPGMLVTLDKKSDVTDKNGNYTISRTPSGALIQKLQNPQIDKSYSAAPTTVIVKDNQKLKNVNIGVYIPKRTIKGQVMLNNQPLVKGKIIADNGFSLVTINLDSQGKFSYQLKENQYSLTIKDSKNKVKTITNSGSFGDLTKLKVVDKDARSMIWVK